MMRRPRCLSHNSLQVSKPVAQEQQYQAVSAAYRPPAAPQSSAGSQLPPLVWVGVGEWNGCRVEGCILRDDG